MAKKSRILMVMIIIIAIMLTVTSCVSRKRENQAPSAVVNIYPTQSELVDENYFYSKWTASKDPEGGAVTYRINYARTRDGLDDPTFYETVETYFLLPNLEEGIWYWRVTATDNNGNSTKSPIWTFTINGETLPQPVDPEDIPTDPALIVSEVENTSFTLDWPAYEDRQNPSEAVEYVIYVYDQGAGINTRKTEEMGYWMARIAPATTAHTTDTSHTFRNMQSQTLYDWVIVAQNNASQTSVVGSAQVRTGNRAPTQPTLLEPTEGATDVATDVTLSWSASTDPDGDTLKYYVYIDIVKNTNRNVTVEGIEETEYQPEGLEEGRTYYWFIMAKDANGAATRTQTNTFMTHSDGMNVPNTPTPSDGTEGIDATAPPLLEWEHDTNGAQITYSVYLSSNPKNITKKADGISAKQYQIPGLLEGNTRYYWQIEAKDDETDKTTLSGVWTFKTGTIEAPEQTGAKTNSDGTQIELTYNKAMGDPSGKKDSYKVKKENTAYITSRETRVATTYQTVATSKIEMKAGTTNAYVLTLEEAMTNGDKIFIDYTPGNIASTDGGKLAKYENKPVTNMVPGEAPLVSEATATVDTITIAFDKDMKDVPSGAKTQFSVQSGSVLKQIEQITRTASDTYTLTLKDGQTIAYGETVLISYAKGSVQAENEAYLESFAGIAAENTVPAPQPQFVSGETSEDGLTVKITFDREMGDPTGKESQFNLGINENDNTTNRSAPTTTIESATLNTADSKIIELGLSNAVSNGDTLTLDYTAGDVESADGAVLATFTDKPVTNTVPAPLPICTAATMTADGQSVEIGFSRDMRAPTAEEANQFGVLVNGYVNEIESATLSADKRVITLNLQKPIGKHNEVHVSYTKGTVAATNGGLLESFQNKKVNTDALTTIWVIKGIGWNYSTIQDAIDAQETENGDIIMVATGTYRENVDFNGKALLLVSTFGTDPMASSTTIIDGGNNGTAAVTIGTEEHYVSGERSADYNWNTLTQRKDKESSMHYYDAIAGFTIQNGAGESRDTASRKDINRGVPCGINVVGSAEIVYNTITNNGNEITDLNGYGIYVSEGARALIGMNIIQNNYNSWNGAGIYLESYNDFSSGRDMGATALIAMNEIKDNKARKGAGIYIEDGVNVEGLNTGGYGEYWKHFNAPNAEVLFVEQASTQTVNSYSNNTLIEEDYSAQRIAIQEGSDIYWEVEEDTLAGSLSLRPETAYEQTEVTLNLDYTIGCEYHNGSVVFTIGENSGQNFEITAGASVVIGEEATAITTYSYSTSVATVTGIKLEAGTVTLRLTPQETPAGTVVNTISTRDLDYIMSAVGDADGSDSVWSETTASTTTFVAKDLSIVTDIAYKTGNELYVQLNTNPTNLRVASETTVNTVLACIKATDDSSQTYAIVTASGTQTGEDELTEAATLIVTAEHGNTQAYAIAINVTKFVKLETSANVSGGRLISRTGANTSISWHNTISDAADSAADTNQSTITVWPGRYAGNIDFGSKPIYLKSSDPENTKETTIIDANYEGMGISIYQNTGVVIIEGFTITHAGASQEPDDSSSRDKAPSDAININRGTVIIRNNIITANGKEDKNNSGYGIFMNSTVATICNNTISNNYNSSDGADGAGIRIPNGTGTIYDNTFTNNVSSSKGGAITLGQYLNSGEVNTFVQLYANTFTDNTALLGGAIAVYENASVTNKNGDDWRRFNVPNATIIFVENGTDGNNTYSGNRNTQEPELIVSRDTIEEGKDIWFAGEGIKSASGTLSLSPATATGDAGEKITLTATYTIDFPVWDGRVTFKSPFTVSNSASITIGTDKRAIEPSELKGTVQVEVSGINCTDTQTVALTFTHTPDTAMAEKEYGFTGKVDLDGPGTHYGSSDLSQATLTIPPQYDAPDVAVVSPIEGFESTKTTVTFTWEATPGEQSNTSARETAGIDSYIVAFAGNDNTWASATVDGETTEYATETLDYAQVYNWRVKAIGKNGKTTTTTPDATFMTSYRIKDLGAGNYSITGSGNPLVLSFNKTDLPERFDSVTGFRVVVNDGAPTGDDWKGFQFIAGENGNYSAEIQLVNAFNDEQRKIMIENGIFGEYIVPAVSLRQGSNESGYDTLAEAVAAVNAIESGDDITVILNNELYQEGARMDLYNKIPVTFKSAEGINSAVDSSNSNSGTFYVVSQTTEATVTFEGITFKNANTSSTGYGGSFSVSNSKVVIQDCVFASNTVSGSKYSRALGGAIIVYKVDKPTLLWVKNTIFDNNTVETNTTTCGGGAIAVRSSADLKIENSTITNNQVKFGKGGALYLESSVTASVTNTTIASNTAYDHGGGIYSEGELAIDNSTICYNETEEGRGGALYLDSTKTTTIDHTLIASNTANAFAQFGGGIYLMNNAGSVFNLTASTICSNTATGGFGKGGGMFIYNEESSMGTVNIGGWNPLNGLGAGSYEFNTAFSVAADGTKKEPAVLTDPIQFYDNEAANGSELYLSVVE